MKMSLSLYKDIPYMYFFSMTESTAKIASAAAEVESWSYRKGCTMFYYHHIIKGVSVWRVSLEDVR